jgi:hypothetical protein
MRVEAGLMSRNKKGFLQFFFVVSAPAKSVFALRDRPLRVAAQGQNSLHLL